MADWLKDKFPDEMTIVMQHQYSDFKVYDDRFEIGLSFGGQLQHLRVPFIAVTRFFDPSTNFGVQMDPVEGRVTDGSPTILPRKSRDYRMAPPPRLPSRLKGRWFRSTHSAASRAR